MKDIPNKVLIERLPNGDVIMFDAIGSVFLDYGEGIWEQIFPPGMNRERVSQLWHITSDPLTAQRIAKE